MQGHRKSMELNIAEKQKRNIEKERAVNEITENERFLHIKIWMGTQRPGKDWK